MLTLADIAKRHNVDFNMVQMAPVSYDASTKSGVDRDDGIENVQERPEETIV